MCVDGIVQWGRNPEMEMRNEDGWMRESGSEAG
jgi:hypothetical protein